MDSSKYSTSTHLFTLVRFHFVPWFPFSLSVGDLASVNGIHQWSVIRHWSVMFEFDTFIRVMRHVLATICVEDLWVWWHSIYATSLFVPVSMRFQLSCPYSSVPFDFFIQNGGLTSVYIVCGNGHLWHMYIMPIHGHCTIRYMRLLCICSHV